MRTLLLATAASLAFATPALARDGSIYAGVEGGALFVGDMDVDGAVDFDDPLVADIDFKTGYDIDAILGYDFGMFRLEGELGYKRAKADNLELAPGFLTAINTAAGTAFTDEDFDLDGKVSVLSGMLNGMVDFGASDSINFSLGAGVGRARVKALGESDSAWAYQLIAGARMPVSDNVDVGLKYRYFRTGKLNFADEFDFVPVGAGLSGGTAFLDTSDRFSSHSLLASLIFNFGGAVAAPEPAPLPPPPPPPAAPATQTCPDGSVIAVTDSCPLPPPPPPPPAPVERGERGR